MGQATPECILLDPSAGFSTASLRLNDMTPSQEKKYLVAVLKQIDGGPSPIFQSLWFDVLVWFAVALIFFVLFQVGDRIHSLIFALASLFVGILAGLFGFAQLAIKRWPYFRPHVDRNSVVRRLSELES